MNGARMRCPYDTVQRSRPAVGKMDVCGRPKKAVITAAFMGFVLFLLFTMITSGPLYRSTSLSSGEAQHFPQAIIIGVKKGGTKALLTMLSTHPQIRTAKGEIHFFDKNETFRKGVKWYVQQMPFSSPDQMTIEKSPSYFITPYAPQRLYKVFPTVKILLIVRDPIERTISDYIQLFNPDRIGKDRSFDDVVLDGPDHVNDRAQVVRVSCYDVHIVQWLKYFPVEQIHIVNGDALITNPAQELIRVQGFLGISNFFRTEMFYFNSTKGFYCWHKRTGRGDVLPNCLGSGKGHQHPTISKTTRDVLKRFFSPHNERFFELIGRHFAWNT